MPEEHSGQTDGTIYLDKPRRLKWTLKALKEMSNLQSDDTQSFEFITQALTLGLKWEDPDITPEKVEEIVDSDNLPEVIKAINDVLARLGSGGSNGSTPLAGLISGQSANMTSDSPAENSGS